MIYLYWCDRRRWKAGGSEKRADSMRLTSFLSVCWLCTQVSHWVSFLCLPAASRSYPTPPPSAAQVTQPWYHSAGCGGLTPSIIQRETGFTSWCWAAVGPILLGYMWTEHAEMKNSCALKQNVALYVLWLKNTTKKNETTSVVLCCYCGTYPVTWEV